MQRLVADAFKGVKGMEFKPDQNFSLDTLTPEPLTEPEDMVIVEPPCHPNEPVKVPDMDDGPCALPRLRNTVCFLTGPTPAS